jgi:hypothetical protein
MTRVLLHTFDILAADEIAHLIVVAAPPSYFPAEEIIP